MSSDKAEKLLDSIVSRVDNITEPDYKSEALSQIAVATFIFGTIKLYCVVLTL
jgi:hypothetical protein